jgi:type I restriction enzyme, S subunit
MNPAQLLARFDRISDAPNAIPHLRQFILDLAVRGKLVEQDPMDEPASELLERVRAEKARLAKECKSKRQASAPQIGDEELPFPAPFGWCWERLATISRRIHYGFTASANRSLSDVRLLRITDIQNNLVDWSSVPGCEISLRETAQYRLHRGDILIARTGGTIGKTFLVGEIPVVAVFASYLIRVQGSSEIYDRYLKLFLESPAYWTQLQDGARGAGQPNVNGQTLGRMIVTVPPIAEQHRIVAKVDELMALCDRLEAVQAERERRRDRLAVASLHRLNQPSDTGTTEVFREHARFYLNYLPRLTARPDQIKQLRQTILNLAVRGQLVPQDRNDEPASVLLGWIQAEKLRLTKLSKAKDKDIIPTDKGDLPFHLRPGWSWCQIDDIAVKVTDGEHATPKREVSGYFLLSARNVKEDGIDLRDVDFVGEEEYRRIRMRCDPDKWDVVISCSGSVGRVAIVDRDDAYVMVRSCALIKPMAARSLSPYLALALRSPCLQSQIVERSKATAQANLFIGAIRQLLIPLPPLGEQRRVVAKVDELMSVCDQLETELGTAQTESRRLLEAVLHEALARAAPETL